MVAILHIWIFFTIILEITGMYYLIAIHVDYIHYLITCTCQLHVGVLTLDHQ